MRLGIRSKFIAILVIASVLPLILGLFSIRFLGKETYCANKGSLFQAMAQYLARNVEQYILIKVENVQDWVTYSDLGKINLNDTDSGEEQLGDAEQKAALDLNDRWPGLDSNSPVLQSYLSNPRADRIRRFMEHNPLFVEAFLTDRFGRLVAISNKTSDYWQSDEVWWQRAAALRPDQVYVEGIHFDESAGAHTLDVAVPVWTEVNGAPVFTGVLKAVLNAGPLFQSLSPILKGNRPKRALVDEDGRIVLELFGEAFEPLSRSIGPDPRGKFGSSQQGWVIAASVSDQEHIFGFAALNLEGPGVLGEVVSGLRPMYLVVHDDLGSVMAPFQKQMTRVGLFGGLLVLVFFFVGDLIANRKIIRPLKVIQNAAQQISLSAHLTQDKDADHESAEVSLDHAIDVVAKVAKIHTQDEIQDLAGDFERMSDRVMNYRAHLEKEIASKTEEIQGDLVFAREFQEALMPMTYPKIPSEAGKDPIELQFHHVYQPASSVSGDFFDIQKIDDHSAGILIVDVMGHGARSALITAIIRTLSQNFKYAANEPGRFLTLMNEAFRTMIPPDEVIFATALYLVVNTEKKTVTYCSAGHMAPILIRRETGTVQPLYDVEEGRYQYAIGLMPDITYREETAILQPRDVLLLYTDGLVEAVNEDGEEFESRMQAVIEHAIHKDLQGLCNAVVQGLNQFLGTVVSQDDICLVGVEAGSPVPVSTPSDEEN